MNTYLKDGRHKGEKKDCSVIAFSYAFNIDYTEAHRLCKQAGRKDNGSFDLRQLIGFGKRVLGKRTQFIFMKHFVQLYDRPKMTVGRFRDSHKEGTYILRVGGHVFTIIDSVIFNNSNNNAIISWYYKITPKLI